MKVMVFLDDNKGMMFHHRRQSRDKVLIERIQRICKGHRLWMNTYSYKLYSEIADSCVSEKFMQEAEKDDFCLVEMDHLKLYEDKIERLIVYWWNRKYPSDFQFDLDLREWKLISSEEFSGFSHDKITEEIYEKRRTES